MKSKKYLLSIGFCFLFFFGNGQNKYKTDFLYLWNEIDKNYAYFDTKTTNWKAVKEHYEPLTDTLSHPYYFTLFLEKVLLELYDPHTHLKTNTGESIRLTSSGMDIWMTEKNGAFYIEEIRQGSLASNKLKAGDEIIKMNGVAVSEGIKKYIGKFVKTNPAVISNAVNLLVAGNYKSERTFTILRNNKELELNIGVCEYPKDETDLLISKKLDKNIGYIKIENSLGNEELIAKFDHALDNLLETKALILDLRNTSSGGDSSIGIPILGRFINKEIPYQNHNRVSEGKKWNEMVIPRGAYYSKKLYVLVNRWTGSMGEGVTIGLDAFGNAEIIGTQMAGLLGANYTITLPENGYNVNIVFEKLSHIDGTPREHFVPKHLIEPFKTPFEKDPYLKKALELINR